MSEDEEKENRENKANIRVTKFSRRQFLKRVGITAGGAVIASISLTSACKSSGSTTATTTTDTPITTGLYYVPPTTLPPFIIVPGTECKVATDRLYSRDHLWVKSVSTNIVVIGITAPMEKILGEPFKIALPAAGITLARDDDFGTIEGFKISADLISPVSGKVVQINEYLKTWMFQGQIIEPVVNDPYNTGWMIAIQLSTPDELETLLTAQQYSALVAKK